MHLAEDLLATTNLTVGAIAARVDYDAEEAFSRAFRRGHGRPPAQCRAARAAS
jgi:AraC-like DNA-binding protein